MVARALRLAAPLLLLVLGTTFVACGGDSTPTTAPSTTSPSATTTATSTTTAAPSATATAAADTLTIQGTAFHPTMLTVKAGTTITIDNKDSFAHTVTADDGSFDTGSIAGGSSTTLDLKTAGTFTFHCNIHPTTMKGTFVVE
jgi:plastocyanin